MQLSKSNSSYGRWAVSFQGKHTQEMKFFWTKEQAEAFMVEGNQSKYSVGDKVRYADKDQSVYEITDVVNGVFGGHEYRTKEIDGTRVGIGFDTSLVAV